MPSHDIIVIGASAGGVQALTELIRELPADLPAAIFVVLHLGAGKSALPEILTRAGSLPVGHPVHGEPIRRGRIYTAPPDRHLLVSNGRLLLERGAKENGHRPAIDVLFRSAAQAYGPRVVGMVLTGNLDDGTAGLLAIKRLGGVAVVQDPEEADYPGMPQSAIENVEVDHVVRLTGVAPLLVQLTHEAVAQGPPGKAPPLPKESAMGARGNGNRANGGSGVAEELLGESGEDLGVASGFTCPDCGGGLWESQDGALVRFRCHTGHAYSPETLASNQAEGVDDALWAALRSLQENASLARRMAGRMHDRGLVQAETRYLERAFEAERYAATLRGILLVPEPAKVEVGEAVEAR
jgi:two-component system chemotaxis response regulator CheB